MLKWKRQMGEKKNRRNNIFKKMKMKIVRDMRYRYCVRIVSHGPVTRSMSNIDFHMLVTVFCKS